MSDRTVFRLRDITDAVDQIEKILDDKTFTEVVSDRLLCAGFERFLEIISEASRHIPTELKDAAPEIPWPDVAAIGNHLRHAYHRVDFQILWRIYEDGELYALRAAAKKLLETHR
jgi:uncharacterized protein with HEPN domain